MTNDPILRTATIQPKYCRHTHTLKALGGLHYLKGNRKPYFSLTYDEYDTRHQCESGGASHEDILKHWPELADLAALHLSNIDGVPMHAEANGWYDLAGALPDHAGEEYHAGNSQRHFPKPKGAPQRGEWDTTDYRNPTPDECLQIFADHVRIPLAEAVKVRDMIIQRWKDTREMNEVPENMGDSALAWSKASWKGARVLFGVWIAEQYPRWKAEADACIAKHGLKIYGDPWPGENAA